jgi:hypothetical protein
MGFPSDLLERAADTFSVVLAPFRRVPLRFYTELRQELMGLENKLIAIVPYNRS